MIDESLSNFLENTVTPQSYKLYMDAISYLESIEYDSIQDELVEIIYEYALDEEDAVPKSEPDIVSQIYRHIYAKVSDSIRLFGIELNEECSLQSIMDIGIALSMISDYEDKGSILAICNLDATSNEKFGELLQLMTSVPTEQWMMEVESVDKKFFEKLEEITNRIVDIEYQGELLDADRLNKLRIYSEFNSHMFPNLTCINSVGSVVMGKPIRFYFQSGIIQELISEGNLEVLAREMYGFGLMSEQSKSDLSMTLKEITEEYMDDIQSIFKVNKEIGKLHLEFNRFLNSTNKETGF